MWVGRICVIGISIISVVLALNPGAKVLALVSYAWGGFGAIFGPAVIATLYFENLNWKSVFTGMIAGTVVLLAWKHLGYGAYLYELLPGFIANGFGIMVGEKILFSAGTEEEGEIA